MGGGDEAGVHFSSNGLSDLGRGNVDDIDDDDDGLALVLSMLDAEAAQAVPIPTQCARAAEAAAEVPIARQAPPLSHDRSSACVSQSHPQPHCEKTTHAAPRPQARPKLTGVSPTSAAHAAPAADQEDESLRLALQVSEAAAPKRRVVSRARRLLGRKIFPRARRPPDRTDETDDNHNNDKHDEHQDATATRVWTYCEEYALADVFTSVEPPKQQAELARRVPGCSWKEGFDRFQTLCATDRRKPGDEDGDADGDADGWKPPCGGRLERDAGMKPRCFIRKMVSRFR